MTYATKVALAYKARLEAAKAQIEAYQRQINAYAAQVQYGDLVVNIEKGQMKMKTVMVVYEVSNGFMAVVGDDRDNGTVVAETLTDVTKAAEAKYCAMKLQGEGKVSTQDAAMGLNDYMNDYVNHATKALAQSQIAAGLAQFNQGFNVPVMPPPPADFGQCPSIPNLPALSDKLDAIRYAALKAGAKMLCEAEHDGEATQVSGVVRGDSTKHRPA